MKTLFNPKATGTGKYGIFLYDDSHDSEPPIISFYSNDPAQAIALAEEMKLQPGQYVEVWERDAEGLFGVSGTPLYKSDEPISNDMPDYEGPWSVEDIGSGGDIHFEIRDAQSDLVAELRFDREPDWDEEAVVKQEQVYLDRANLIAAVPDMYREIEEEIARLGGWMKALANGDPDDVEDIMEGMEISIDNFKRLLDQAKGEHQ